VKTWGEVVGRPEIKDEIHVYTRSDSAGAADTWAKYLGDKKQDSLKGIGVNADPGVLTAVQKDPLV
jgi:phosphate transport system substrate-binding protein